MRGKNASASPPIRQRERFSAILSSIKACAESRDLKRGQGIHRQTVAAGDDSNTFVSSALVSMYSRCGSMDDARAVFDSMKHRDVVSWTSLIAGYAENGNGETALRVFGEMIRAPAKVAPDRPTFLAALKACSTLAAKEEPAGQTKLYGISLKIKCLNECMSLHSQAAKLGLDRSDVFVASGFVDLYAKCGSMLDSRRVFDRMEARSVVSWTSLLRGYCENEKPELALGLFSCMTCLEPDAPTFVAVLNACTSLATKEPAQVVDDKVIKLKSLETGRDLHALAAKKGWNSDVVVTGALVDLYAKCGSLVEASDVFHKAPNRSVVSLTALMLGLVENGEPEIALKIFARAQSEKRLVPDARAFVAALKACASMAEREEGRRIDGKLIKATSVEKGRALHSQAMKRGLDSDMFLASTLVDMYSKCGSLTCARRVFNGMARHDIVSWTALLLGHAEGGDEEVAMELFASMKKKGYSVDSRTLGAAVRACFGLAEKEQGTVTADRSVIKAGALRRGLELETEAKKSGRLDVFLASNLLGLFAKCGSLRDARRVFDKMSRRDVVSWTTLILGHVENREPEAAFDLFARMKAEGFEPDSGSFVAMLKACSNLAAREDAGKNSSAAKAEALERGKDVHSQAVDRGCDSDKLVASKILEMYTKCGSMDDARKFFDAVPGPSYELSVELMLGYFENNEHGLGFELFEKLARAPQDKDPRIFLGALKSCGITARLDTLRTVHAEILRSGATQNGNNDLVDDDAISNALIDAYGKCSSTSDARLVFESANNRSSIGWTSLISAYSRNGGIATVLDLFEAMEGEGVRPDAVALSCLMTAFSRAGMVDRGRKLMEEMEINYGIKPAIEHYSCLVDLLGRANELEEAGEIARAMPEETSALAWRTLLGACHKWKNATMGRVAFEALTRMNEDDAAAYVLMTNMLKWRNQ